MTDLKPTEMTGKEMRTMRAGPDEAEQLTKQSQTQSAHLVCQVLEAVLLLVAGNHHYLPIAGGGGVGWRGEEGDFIRDPPSGNPF